MPIPLSIQLYTVRDLIKTPADYIKTVTAIADIGYVAVEGGGYGPIGKGDYDKLLADTGLGVSSWWSTPNKDNVQKHVEIAQEYGLTHFVGSFGPNEFRDRAATLDTAAKFESAAQLLAPHGLSMCYHNHYWEFANQFDGQTAWDVLFEAAPSLCAELDLYWASNFGATDVPAVVRRYTNRAPLFHAKDGPLVKDQPNTAVGKGAFDVKAAVAAADPLSLKWLIVELDNYVGGNANMLDAVRDSYAYLTQSGLGAGRK